MHCAGPKARTVGYLKWRWVAGNLEGSVSVWDQLVVVVRRRRLDEYHVTDSEGIAYPWVGFRAFFLHQGLGRA